MIKMKKTASMTTPPIMRPAMAMPFPFRYCGSRLNRPKEIIPKTRAGTASTSVNKPRIPHTKLATAYPSVGPSVRCRCCRLAALLAFPRTKLSAIRSLNFSLRPSLFSTASRLRSSTEIVVCSTGGATPKAACKGENRSKEKSNRPSERSNIK